MTHDFKISGDARAILGIRDLSKVQLKNDDVQVFNTMLDEMYCQRSLTDVPTVNWKVCTSCKLTSRKK